MDYYDIYYYIIKRDIHRFSKVLKNNFKKEDLKIYMNNISSVELYLERSKKANQKYITCRYDTENNRLELLGLDYINIEDVIYHELFHLASGYYDNDDKLVFLGFEVDSKEGSKFNIEFGYGLNEGYTEFLRERYFGKPSSITDKSRYVKNISACVEKIIGKNKMEKFYLNYNSYKLIKELHKYAQQDDITDFIEKLDFLFDKFHELQFKTKNEYFNEDYIAYFEDINNFLIKSYFNKLSRLSDMKKIDMQEFNERIIRYSNFLHKNMIFSKYIPKKYKTKIHKNK